MADTTGSAALLVAAKELRAALRDPQTVIYAVLLPLALYPVLFWVMIQVATLVESRREAREVTLWLALEAEVERPAAADLAAARARLDAARRALEPQEEGRAAEQLSLVPLERRLARDEVQAIFERRRPGSAPGDASGGGPDWQPLGAAAPPDAVLLARADGLPGLALYFDSAQPDSQLARRRAEARLESGAERARDEQLEAAGRDPAEFEPLDVSGRDLASGEQQGAFLLSMMLPMLLVLMALMGAFYPAVDLTAGECERRTEETTLLLPVPRRAVQLGKLLAVMALSSLAAVLNLAGITLAANHLLAMLGAEDVRIAVGPLALLAALPLALVLVALASAVLLGLASLTRTFKQGQSLLGAVQMVFLLPAAASALPGLSLGGGVAAIPVVGLALGLRAVLRAENFAELPHGLLALALGAHAVYALLALWFALRLLELEFTGEHSPKPLARLRALFARP